MIPKSADKDDELEDGVQAANGEENAANGESAQEAKKNKLAAEARKRKQEQDKSKYVAKVFEKPQVIKKAKIDTQGADNKSAVKKQKKSPIETHKVVAEQKKVPIETKKVTAHQKKAQIDTKKVTAHQKKLPIESKEVVADKASNRKVNGKNKKNAQNKSAANERIRPAAGKIVNGSEETSPKPSKKQKQKQQKAVNGNVEAAVKQKIAKAVPVAPVAKKPVEISSIPEELASKLKKKLQKSNSKQIGQLNNAARTPASKPSTVAGAKPKNKNKKK